VKHAKVRVPGKENLQELLKTLANVEISVGGPCPIAVILKCKQYFNLLGRGFSYDCVTINPDCQLDWI
jgi:hypothetical protein